MHSSLFTFPEWLFNSRLEIFLSTMYCLYVKTHSDISKTFLRKIFYKEKIKCKLTLAWHNNTRPLWFYIIYDPRFLDLLYYTLIHISIIPSESLSILSPPFTIRRTYASVSSTKIIYNCDNAASLGYNKISTRCSKISYWLSPYVVFLTQHVFCGEMSLAQSSGGISL